MARYLCTEWHSTVRKDQCSNSAENSSWPVSCSQILTYGFHWIFTEKRKQGEDENENKRRTTPRGSVSNAAAVTTLIFFVLWFCSGNFEHYSSLITLISCLTQAQRDLLVISDERKWNSPQQSQILKFKEGEQCIESQTIWTFCISR